MKRLVLGELALRLEPHMACNALFLRFHCEFFYLQMCIEHGEGMAVILCR